MSDAPPSGSPLPPPVSRGSAWKVVVSVVIVTGAVAMLLKSSVSDSAQYYKHVDEVMLGDKGPLRGKQLKVHGNVVDGSIEQAKGTLMYRFKIESRAPRAHAVISASYTGLVPDTFKDGAEVVATGGLTADDRLDVVQDGIMAKCPSKYQADDKAEMKNVAQKLPAAGR
jgi:cytochrome c-type biogenesis protein CcmE